MQPNAEGLFLILTLDMMPPLQLQVALVVTYVLCHVNVEAVIAIISLLN